MQGITKNCNTKLICLQQSKEIQARKPEALVIFLRSSFTPSKTAGYSKHIVACLIYFSKVLTILIPSITKQKQNYEPKQFKLPFSGAFTRCGLLSPLTRLLALAQMLIMKDVYCLTSLINPSRCRK